MAVTSALLFLPTCLMGAAVPVAADLATTLTGFGRRIGRLYAANTAGNIAGALAAGFWLLPLLGTQATLRVGAAVHLAAAALVGLAPRALAGRARAATAIGIAAVALAAAMMPPWDPRWLMAGAHVQPERWGGMSSEEVRHRILANQVRFFHEGVATSVAVLEEPAGNLSIVSNGKPEASTTGDMPTQLLLGYVPLCYVEQPRQGLVIGLGSGVSLGALAQAAFERLDCVELEGAMRDAAAWFAPLHHGILDDPRVHLAIEDGRNFLLLNDRRYDIIVSQPSNPWIAGVANLYSVEFFDLARSRLAPSGIMCQWVQLYALSPDDLAGVLRTFHAVFPFVHLWQGGPGDVLLIGSERTLAPEPQPQWERLAQHPVIGRDLAMLGLQSGPALWSHFLLERDAVERLSAGAALSHDDRPHLEFSAPYALYMPGLTARNQRQLWAASAAAADERLARWGTARAAAQYAEGLLGQGRVEEAEAAMRWALGRDADEPRGHLVAGRLRLASGDVAAAEASWQRAEENTDPSASAEASYHLAQMWLTQERFADASGRYRRALAHDPRDVPSLHGLGRALAAQGEHDEVLACYEQAAVAWETGSRRRFVTLMACFNDRSLSLLSA
jgi:spermidine synthase